MADQSSKAPTQSPDAEKAQEKKRRPEPPVQEQAQGLGSEAVALGPLLGSSATDPPVERHAALLGDPRFSHPANAVQRARMVSQIQQTYGNAHVQRVMDRVGAMRDEDVGHEQTNTGAGQRIAGEKGSREPVNPEPSCEIELSLGHELAHHNQQDAGPISSLSNVGRDGAAREASQREAQRNAIPPAQAARADGLQSLANASVMQRQGPGPPTATAGPIKIGLTEAQFNDDYKKAMSHKSSYSGKFENTTSASEFAYGEANRRLVKYSTLTDPKDLWADLGKDLFFAALDLIPALGPIAKAIKRIEDKSQFYAEGMKKLITFTITTVAKYGPKVLISEARSTGVPKDPPSMFLNMRKLRDEEMSRLKKIEIAWVDGHRAAVTQKKPWTEKLETQYKQNLQPEQELPKGPNSDITKKYEEKLWNDYLRDKVRYHYSSYLFKEHALSFKGMSKATAKYLKTRFGWGIWTIAYKCTNQRSVSGWAKMTQGWVDILEEDL